MLNEQLAQSVYQEYYLPVYRYILRRCHDSYLADTITADALAVSLENIEHINNIRSYVFQAAYHKLISWHRETVKLAPVDIIFNKSGDSHLRPIEEYIERKLEQSEMENKSMGALRELPPSQRRTLVLRFIQNRNLKEVSESMGTNIGCVKNNQTRGLQALRKKLGVTSI